MESEGNLTSLLTDSPLRASSPFIEITRRKVFRERRSMPNYPEPKFRGPKRTKAPRPLSRVELHIHLDGSLRMSTIWEISKAKGLSLPGDGSLEALAAHVEMAAPADLTDFLSGFQVRLNPPRFELLQMVLCTININPSLNSTQHPPLSVTWPQLRE